MSTLRRTAAMGPKRDHTLEDVQLLCQRLPLEAPTMTTLPASMLAPPDKPFTVWDLLVFRVNRARALNRELLSFTTFMASDLVRIIANIDNCQYFRNVEGMNPEYYAHMGVRDMSFLAQNLFHYLELVDQLEKYRQEFLVT